MSRPPLVSVVVPARDEERWIDECLVHVLAQDYGRDAIEVIVVVDGATRDATETRAAARLDGAGLARSMVVRNADGGTPGNLNAGLAEARGEVLCRVDARSRVPADYVRRCVALLGSRADLSVVGGAQVAVVPRDDAVGRGIARALNNRWGMGLSRYRRDAASGPADTVYLGAFRTADLRAVGGWSVAFPTNQDFELNRRLAERGTVWYEAGLPVGYVPRSSLADLYRQYDRFGRWKVRYWRRTGDRPRPRQLALLLGVPAAIAVGVAAAVVVPTPARVAMGVGAAAVAVAIEAGGSRRPAAEPLAHAVAGVALAAVGLGWLAGAWAELLTGGDHGG